MYVRGNPATHRSQGEDRYTQDEHQAAAKQITKRTPDENQRSQEESVGLDHPLHINYRCMKAGLERRQSDIDDGAVDEGHAGTDNGRGEYPWSCFCRTKNPDVSRLDYGFVARRSGEH